MASDNDKKIYVANLPYETTRDELRDVMQQSFGDVGGQVIMTDKESGKSRGYGFVWFKHLDGFNAAIATKDLEISGRKIRIEAAKPRVEQPAK